MELGKYGPNIMRELCGSYAGCRKYKFVIHDAGNYAGSIEWHELVFCAQASWEKNMYYAGTARNQPPQPTPAHDNIYLILYIVYHIL